MKIKGEFIMRQVLDEYVLVPVNDTALHFNGIIRLTSVSALIWEKLEKGADHEAILNDLLQEFNVERETAAADLDEFLQILQEKGLVEDL